MQPYTFVNVYICTCTYSLVLLLVQLSKQKRKFSSFFKSLVIELDKDLYGPDNHLVEVRKLCPLCVQASSGTHKHLAPVASLV